MECGECTLCCELLNINSLKATKGNIIEAIIIDSPAGSLCEHCIEKKGCGVHEERPKICRDYFCAYAQQEDAPIQLRPDNCGIIFEKLDEDIFVGTLKPGVKVSDYGMQQIGVFNKQGYNVVLTKYDERQPKFFPREGQRPSELVKKFIEHIKKSNG